MKSLNWFSVQPNSLLVVAYKTTVFGELDDKLILVTEIQFPLKIRVCIHVLLIENVYVYGHLKAYFFTAFRAHLFENC